MKRFSIYLLLFISMLFSGGTAFAAIEWKAPENVSQGRGFILTFQSENPFEGEVFWRKKNISLFSSVQSQMAKPSSKVNTKENVKVKTKTKTKANDNAKIKKLYTAQILLGMPVDAKGTHTLSIVMEENINGKLHITQESALIKSLPVKWVSHNLKVESKYVQPPQEVLARIKAEREKRAPIMANISPNPTWELPFFRPVKGTISGSFAARRVFNNVPRSPHMGTDMRGAIGTPIYSMAAGKVMLAEHHYYSGNVVYVDHGQGVISMYGHMSAITVKKGDVVKKGQELGKVGATGRVTGPHLHLSLYIQGVAVDAIPFVKEKLEFVGGPTPEQARPPVPKKKKKAKSEK